MHKAHKERYLIPIVYAFIGFGVGIVMTLIGVTLAVQCML
mgnify:CR=1 FL=1